MHIAIEILQFVLLFICGIALGRASKGVQQFVLEATACVRVAQIIKTTDPTLTNDEALKLAQGVIEWAQARTT